MRPDILQINRFPHQLKMHFDRRFKFGDLNSIGRTHFGTHTYTKITPIQRLVHFRDHLVHFTFGQTMPNSWIPSPWDNGVLRNGRKSFPLTMRRHSTHITLSSKHASSIFDGVNVYCCIIIGKNNVLYLFDSQWEKKKLKLPRNACVLVSKNETPVANETVNHTICILFQLSIGMQQKILFTQQHYSQQQCKV